uniref:SRCR domain-containing protein n=1 Tax=Caenorhabditis tropicalis TaxID=1561998 RepID=A0A1I7TBN6_9PELO
MIRLILLLSLPLLVDAGCAVDFKHSTQEPAEDEATTTQSDVCKPGFRRFHRVDLRVVVCMKITTSDTVVSKEQAAALCTAEGYKLMGLNNVNEGVDLRGELWNVSEMSTNHLQWICLH